MGEFVSFPDFKLGEPGEFVTVGNLVYVDGDDIVTVPSGFRTDFASIPNIPGVYLIYDKTKHGRRAAVVHDYLCRLANSLMDYEGRVYADRLFRQILIETGTARWRAYTMWAAVRLNTWRLKMKGKLK